MGKAERQLAEQRRLLESESFLDRALAGYSGRSTHAILQSYGAANVFTGGAVETSRQFHQAFRGGHISLAAFEEGVAQARTRGLIFGGINAVLMIATFALAGPVLGTSAGLGQQVLFYGGSAAITTIASMGATSAYTARHPLRDPYAQQIWRQGEYTTGQILLGGAISFGLGAAIPLVSWLARPANAGAARALVLASAEGRPLPSLGPGLERRMVSPGVVEITQTGSPGAVRVSAEGWELYLAAGRGQAPVLAEPWGAANLPPVRPELLQQAPHLAGLRDVAAVSLGGRPFGVGVSAEGWFAVAPGTRTPFLTGTFGLPGAPGGGGGVAGPLVPPSLAGAGAGGGPVYVLAAPPAVPQLSPGFIPRQLPALTPLPAPSGYGPLGIPLGSGPLIVDLQAGPQVGILPTHPGFGQRSYLAQTVLSIPGARGVAVESADFLLGFPTPRAGLFGEPNTLVPGVYPTDPRDLALARQLVQSTPLWPPYTAGQVGRALRGWPEEQLATAPFALQPWQINPSMAFPRSGPVVVLTEPTGAPSEFFPATGGPSASGDPRLVPLNQGDVQALRPSTLPQLYGLADRVLWRRPFALFRATPDVVAAMGQEINRLLKPGGFADLRVLEPDDVPIVQGLSAHIQGARRVEVPRQAIEYFLGRDGRRWPGLNDEQWRILQEAAPDIRREQPTLGRGAFESIIRIYKGS
jgi:hypothetical protein